MNNIFHATQLSSVYNERAVSAASIFLFSSFLPITRACADDNSYATKIYYWHKEAKKFPLIYACVYKLCDYVLENLADSFSFLKMWI